MYLTDQWLIAEYRELPMVVGQLRVNGWQIKSPIPRFFSLGKGHMNFMKFRLAYLQRRHEAVKKEMISRGFKCDKLHIHRQDCQSDEFWNDWTPNIEDSQKIRFRLEDKIRNNKLPYTWWRYRGENLTQFNIESFIYNFRFGELYYV